MAHWTTGKTSKQNKSQGMQTICWVMHAQCFVLSCNWDGLKQPFCFCSSWFNICKLLGFEVRLSLGVQLTSQYCHRLNRPVISVPAKPCILQVNAFSLSEALSWRKNRASQLSRHTWALKHVYTTPSLSCMTCMWESWMYTSLLKNAYTIVQWGWLCC